MRVDAGCCIPWLHSQGENNVVFKTGWKIMFSAFVGMMALFF